MAQTGLRSEFQAVQWTHKARLRLFFFALKDEENLLVRNLGVCEMWRSHFNTQDPDILLFIIRFGRGCESKGPALSIYDWNPHYYITISGITYPPCMVYCEFFGVLNLRGPNAAAEPVLR